jgi:Flp pilus assembly pilin Flp
MFRKLSSLVRREEGQDIIEYALLASFISIVAIPSVRTIGPLVNQMYVNVVTAITP